MVHFPLPCLITGGYSNAGFRGKLGWTWMEIGIGCWKHSYPEGWCFHPVAEETIDQVRLLQVCSFYLKTTCCWFTAGKMSCGGFKIYTSGIWATWKIESTRWGKFRGTPAADMLVGQSLEIWNWPNPSSQEYRTVPLQIVFLMKLIYNNKIRRWLIQHQLMICCSIRISYVILHPSSKNHHLQRLGRPTICWSSPCPPSQPPEQVPLWSVDHPTNGK